MLYDNVEQTTVTSGTGALSLIAPTDASRRSCVQAAGNGGAIFYKVETLDGLHFEYNWGVATAGAPDTLTRNLLWGSNGAAPVNFPAGVKRVFSTLPAIKAVYLDAGGNVACPSSTFALTGATAYLLVGMSTVSGFGVWLNNAGSRGYAQWRKAYGSGSQVAIDFLSGGGSVGSITYGDSSVSYNTSSDYRLKDEFEPLTGALDRLLSLPVHRFRWKATPDAPKVDGFLAHEAQAVVPEAVQGEKDGMQLVDEVDEAGAVIGQNEVPKYQSIDQSKLVPLLVAAVQELAGEVAALKAQISAL